MQLYDVIGVRSRDVDGGSLPERKHVFIELGVEVLNDQDDVLGVGDLDEVVAILAGAGRLRVVGARQGALLRVVVSAAIGSKCYEGGKRL